MYKKYTGVAILAIIILIISSVLGIKQINAGFRGVKTVWGKTIEESLPEGLYFYNAISSKIVEIDCRTKRLENNFSTYTADIQQATLIFTLNYSLSLDSVHSLYKTVGMTYENTIIVPAVEGSVKEVIGKWDASTLVSNRDKAGDQIKEFLAKRLAKNNIIITSVEIRDIEYTPQFEKAIEDKQIATQDALKTINMTQKIEEQARQKTIEANNAKEILIINAQGYAESVKLKAEADANAIAIKSEALSSSPNFLYYSMIELWDGALPKFISSGDGGIGTLLNADFNKDLELNQPKSKKTKEEK